MNNVSIESDDRMFTFSFRPSLYEVNDVLNFEMLNHVQRNVQKGSVIERSIEVYFDSDDRRVNGLISVDLQKEIQELAKIEGMSVEEMVGRLLEESLTEKEPTPEQKQEVSLYDR